MAEDCCEETMQLLVNELAAKIASIGCEINNREKVGRDVNKLWRNSTKLLNIQWMIDNLCCCLTCEEVETLRCVVKKTKSY